MVRPHSLAVLAFLVGTFLSACSIVPDPNKMRMAVAEYNNYPVNKAMVGVLSSFYVFRSYSNPTVNSAIENAMAACHDYQSKNGLSSDDCVLIANNDKFYLDIVAFTSDEAAKR